MADEILTRDENSIPVVGGITNDASTDIVALRVDPTTKRLLVDVSGGGGTSIVDDSAFTIGTTSVTPIGGLFDDVSPDSVDEGDEGAVRMSANRNLYVTLRDAAGNERGANVDASNRLGVVADLGATDNAVLDQIEVNTSYGDNTGGGTETGALRVTIANNSTGVLSVDDNGGNLSVDWAGTVPPIGAGTEAAALRVTVATDSTGVLSVDDNGSALTVDNAGTFAVQVDGAALTALQLLDNIVTIEDTASANGDSGIVTFARRTATPADTSGLDGDYEALQMDNGRLWTSATIDAALPAGTNAIGKLVANSGVDIGDVDVLSLPALATGSNTIGKLASNSGVDIGDVTINNAAGSPVYNSSEANASATGCDTLFDSDGDNTAQQCKASAGVLYGIEVSNPNSADAYLQLFDLATGSVTVGTTTPKLSFFVPAGDGTKDGAMDKFFVVPIGFATAITYACTTTATGNGDPTTGLIVNLIYK